MCNRWICEEYNFMSNTHSAHYCFSFYYNNIIIHMLYQFLYKNSPLQIYIIMLKFIAITKKFVENILPKEKQIYKPLGRWAVEKSNEIINRKIDLCNYDNSYILHNNISYIKNKN